MNMAGSAAGWSAGAAADTSSLACLPHDELDTILGLCTAKVLTVVQSTCKELNAAAHRALDAPRFADRKEMAPLGRQLLEACLAKGAWWHFQVKTL